MKGVIFNVMLAWVQLSPPDNATSSSVCVTGQLFPLWGIYLGEGDVDFKVFGIMAEFTCWNSESSNPMKSLFLWLGLFFSPWQANVDFSSSIGMSVLSFMNAHAGLQKVVTEEGCQKIELQRKFNYGIKLLNKIRDIIELEYGPALNEDCGDVSCHHVSCIVLNPIKSNSNFLQACSWWVLFSVFTACFAKERKKGFFNLHKFHCSLKEEEAKAKFSRHKGMNRTCSAAAILTPRVLSTARSLLHTKTTPVSIQALVEQTLLCSQPSLFLNWFCGFIRKNSVSLEMPQVHFWGEAGSNEQLHCLASLIHLQLGDHRGGKCWEKREEMCLMVLSFFLDRLLVWLTLKERLDSSSAPDRC